jgi:helicase SWR1
MDRQCEDRAHRIGQIRDVHVYRFVSQYTVEEALLLKANQKRSLDDLVIQKGEFDWRTLFNDDQATALATAMSGHEDAEDIEAASISAREYRDLMGADAVDFDQQDLVTIAQPDNRPISGGGEVAPDEAVDEEDGGTVLEYMLQYVTRDTEEDYFREWNLD